MIPYGHQWIDDDDISAVVDVLKSDYLTQGPIVEKFEKKLADYCGSKYAVAFSSGTAALHSAYFAIGLSEGDEFITSPITFCATANSGLYLGANVKFCDIMPDGNMDIDKISELITDKTKLVVPIHYGGFSVEMKKLREVVGDGIGIVEDGCHALGGRYRGGQVGSCLFSDITVFSFHPIKSITTGEGGAATTNSEELYQKMLMFRSHGITKCADKMSRYDGDWYYEMHHLGNNYRMSEIHGSLGRTQLKKIDKFMKLRKRIALKYNEYFGGNPYFDIVDNSRIEESALHLYPILLKDGYVKYKRTIFEQLRKRNIGVQCHYIPVFKLPYYSTLNLEVNCPESERFYRREISLPIYPSLKMDEVDYIAITLFDIFKKIEKI